VFFACIRANLSQFSENNSIKNLTFCVTICFFDAFEQLIALSQSHNGWYTRSKFIFPFNLANALTEDQLNQWLSKYEFSGRGE
jgi:hypothetical protein